MSPLMSRRGSCALLGNLERPVFELQSLVTIVVLVLSLYDYSMYQECAKSISKCAEIDNADVRTC